MSPLQAALCFTVLLSHIVLPSYAFRPDYTFIKTTRSYYKYHKEKGSWNDTVTKCNTEGAILFYPENEVELAQVLDVMKVGDNYGQLLLIGISDLREMGVYETVDGRPVSQVYNKWYPGEPSSGVNNEYRCVTLNVNDGTLYVNRCGLVRPYICKFVQTMEDVVWTAIEEVKTAIDNASDKQIAALERLTATMQQQAANQTAALGRQAEAIQRLALALEKLAENNDQVYIPTQT